MYDFRTQWITKSILIIAWWEWNNFLDGTSNIFAAELRFTTISDWLTTKLWLPIPLCIIVQTDTHENVVVYVVQQAHKPFYFNEQHTRTR